MFSVTFVILVSFPRHLGASIVWFGFYKICLCDPSLSFNFKEYCLVLSCVFFSILCDLLLFFSFLVVVLVSFFFLAF